MIALQRSPPKELPLISMKIPTGPLAPAEDSYIEDRIDLSMYLAPNHDRTFLIRVDGESLIGLGVFPNDLLVVERGAEAKNGDVVVAMVAGQFTVKQFRCREGNLSLVPTNKTLPEFREQDFSIWGVVRFALHKL